MKIVLVAAALMAAFALPAQARDWWMLNPGDARCDRLTNLTPADFAAYMRDKGMVLTTKVVRNDAGDVVAVILSASDRFWTYTTSAAICQNLLRKEVSNGDIVPPSDLR